MNEPRSSSQIVSSEEVSTLALAPFVGAASIQTGRHLFGRQREVYDLVDLLISRRIILLHAPSGAGKTSLVNAGLIPFLEEERFHLYPVIRVNKEARQSVAKRAKPEALNRYVYSAVRSLEEERPESEQLPISVATSISLPEYLDLRAEELAEDEAVVLMFDQFEEIIRVDPIDLAVKKVFFEQLGQALRDTRRWALFIMRDDYVGTLDPYLSYLPTQLSVRMHLDLLAVSAAQLAIRRPKPAQVRFESDSVFDTFSKNAAQKLATDLSQIRVHGENLAGPYVEPVHLQIVCTRLWDGRPDGVEEIDSDLVEKSESVDEALAGYYADIVYRVSTELGIPEWLLRDWFGTKLITAQGIRGQIMRDAPESDRLGARAIAELVDAYLVREEPRRGVTYYELAHDRLVSPIIQDNERWQGENLSPYYAQAARWKALDEPPDMLLEENQLLELEQWEQDNPGALTNEEEELIESSRDLLERSREKHFDQFKRQASVDQLGWGVIFTHDAEPALYEALSELLTLRQVQATERNPEFYREFSYRPGESARQFLTRHGIGTGPVDPEKIPHYLLIVGDPESIPFEFQYELDLQYSVGRIYFEEPEAYASYARSVVAAEEGRVKLPRRAAFFSTAHADDRATEMTAQHVVGPMVERSRKAYRDWEILDFIGEMATKRELAQLLAGEQAPALLFAAGHGMQFSAGHPRQLADQGAFLCQDYPGPRKWSGEILPDFYFGASDVPEEASLIGMIAFFGSAHSAGVPAIDDFAHTGVEAKAMAEKAFVTRLPQGLLGHPGGGMLAVCGHVDRPWIIEGGAIEMTVYNEVVRRLMDGHTVGSAMEIFDQRYAVFAARVGERLRQKMASGELWSGTDSDFELTQIVTAMIDARNYVIIGDPAVRLPVVDAGGSVARPLIDVAEAEPPEETTYEVTRAPDSVAKRAPARRAPTFLRPVLESAYVDLEIAIRAGDLPGDYELSMRTALPDSGADIRLDFVPLTMGFEDIQQYLHNPQDLGSALSNMLFGDPRVRSELAQARATAESLGVPLRLRLLIEPSAGRLQSLPWEMLADPRDLDRSILLQNNVLFSRYVPAGDWRAQRLRGRSELRALVVVANPDNLEEYALTPLEVEAELTLVKSALGEIPCTVLDTASTGIGTLSGVVRSLSTTPSFIVYIVAHGRVAKRSGGSEYALFLADEDNQARIVRGHEFNTLFSQLEELPRLVVLTPPSAVQDGSEASPSIIAPALLAAGVPAVLAMQGPIGRQTMASLSSVLFAELANHGVIDRAAAAARRAVQDTEEWWVPALFTRQTGGRLWTLPHLEAGDVGDVEAPFLTPPLPANYVARPGQVDRVVSGLTEADATTRLVALTGAGGIGKTTVAIAACHEDTVRDSFKDGILWVTLGPEPDVHAQLSFLVQMMTGESVRSRDIGEAAGQWKSLAADLSFLLVIDDLWLAQHLTPFLAASPASKYLVTTRNLSAVTGDATRIELMALNPDAAVQLLGAGLAVDERGELLTLAQRLGNYPLVLTLANRMLMQRINLGQDLADAIAYMNRAIDRRGMAAFDQRAASDRDEAVTLSLEASLALLYKKERDRLDELAIFPEDVAIPISIVAQLWRATAGLDEVEVEELCLRFHSLSLLEVDLQSGDVQLHDLISSYLAHHAGDELNTVQQRFLDAYWESHRLKSWSDMPADEPYLWYHLPHHLAGTGDEHAVPDLLYDFGWLQARLIRSGVDSLLEEFEYLSVLDSIDSLLIEALRLSGPLVAADSTLLASQIAGRLGDMELDETDRLLFSIDRAQRDPWLRPLTACLVPAARDAAGHAGPVDHVAVTADGHVSLSASWDKSIQAWDIWRGQKLRTLTGHSDRISSIAVAAHGKVAVSASLDGQINLWRTAKIVADGASTARKGPTSTLTGHDGPVWALAILPDQERFISASTSIRVWNIWNGEPLTYIAGHTDWVHCLVASGDGRRIASASWDGTIGIWNPDNGEMLHRLQGHSALISKIAIDPEGQWLLSAADDRSLIHWDLISGARIRTLTGHTGPVTAFVVTTDARHVISASEDATIKIWELASGRELQSLTAHTGTIRALSLSAGGRRLISSGEDGFLRLWDLPGGSLIASYKGDGAMWSCAMTTDGRRVIAGDSLGRVHILHLELPANGSDSGAG